MHIAPFCDKIINKLNYCIPLRTEDGGYIADIPDLKNCSAFGETPQEALREIEIAKEEWLKIARENGIEIPEPKYRPLIYKVAEA